MLACWHHIVENTIHKHLRILNIYTLYRIMGFKSSFKHEQLPFKNIIFEKSEKSLFCNNFQLNEIVVWKFID